VTVPGGLIEGAIKSVEAGGFYAGNEKKGVLDVPFCKWGT